MSGCDERPKKLLLYVWSFDNGNGCQCSLICSEYNIDGAIVKASNMLEDREMEFWCADCLDGFVGSNLERWMAYIRAVTPSSYTLNVAHFV